MPVTRFSATRSSMDWASAGAAANAVKTAMRSTSMTPPRREETGERSIGLRASLGDE